MLVTAPSPRLIQSLQDLRAQGVPFMPRAELLPWRDNPRFNAATVPRVVALMQRFGWTTPILVRRADNEVIAGHTRMGSAEVLGLTEVPVIWLDMVEADAHLYALADNRTPELTPWTATLPEILQRYGQEDVQLAGWADADGLGRPPDMPPLPTLQGTGGGQQQADVGAARITLAERFGVPPFSVLDARQGYWQDRKRSWIVLGLRSEVGRGANLQGLSGGAEDYRDGVGSYTKGRPMATAFHQASLDALAGVNTVGKGTSIFDPVLCELLLRWFCPQGGAVLDPFAGGSVRGVVAAALGRRYTGIDLRAEQVAANVAQWAEIAPNLPAVGMVPQELPDNDLAVTPIEAVPFAGGTVWVKREDLYAWAGVNGSKARALRAMTEAVPAGLITACARESPQPERLALVAKRLGIPCRVHLPAGKTTETMRVAVELGAELVSHRPGYLSVLIARAHEDAQQRGWLEIPFAVEHTAMVEATRQQVRNIPEAVQRIVVPVGSGVSLAGLLWGLADAGDTRPVLGVKVGQDPEERLDRLAPAGWRERCTLVDAGVDYSKAVQVSVGEIRMDAHYEAKCVAHLLPGDLLWVVGIRQSALRTVVAAARVIPRWVVGDGADAQALAPGQYDMVLTCPPYADLEVYSEDPRDLSRMDWPGFVHAYRAIIASAAGMLRTNRFAAIVVGEVRAPDGPYRGLVPATVAAAEAAGLRLYNEAVLVTAVGSLPLRVRAGFETSRKLGKTHQNVLIFVKGDARKATAAVGPVEFGALPSEDDEVPPG